MRVPFTMSQTQILGAIRMLKVRKLQFAMRVKLTSALVHGLGTQFREKGFEGSRKRAEVSEIELHGRAVVQCAMVL